MLNQLEELIKVREERDQIYAQFTAWGKLLLEIGKKLELYGGQPITLSETDYPTRQQILDTLARYHELQKRDVELYRQLPLNLQKQIIAPPVG